jgi:hypothetical protein
MLKGPDDWADWRRQFANRAAVLGLGDLIWSDEDDELSEPETPKAPGTEAQDWELDAYDALLYIYPEELRDYQRQRRGIRVLKEWVLANIQPMYHDTACNAEESIREWYWNLKAQVGDKVIGKRKQRLLRRKARKAALRAANAESGK